MVVVADGTALAAEKLERVLTTDPGMGVIRHADAGYERAIDVARERGVRVPMLEASRSYDRAAASATSSSVVASSGRTAATMSAVEVASEARMLRPGRRAPRPSRPRGATARAPPGVRPAPGTTPR